MVGPQVWFGCYLWFGAGCRRCHGVRPSGSGPCGRRTGCDTDKSGGSSGGICARAATLTMLAINDVGRRFTFRNGCRRISFRAGGSSSRRQERLHPIGGRKTGILIAIGAQKTAAATAVFPAKRFVVFGCGAAVSGGAEGNGHPLAGERGGKEEGVDVAGGGGLWVAGEKRDGQRQGVRHVPEIHTGIHKPH